MADRATFSDVVRTELASIDPTGFPIDELAGVLRVTGELHLSGREDGVRAEIHVATRSGTVARRLHRLAAELHRTGLEVSTRDRPGLRSAPRYRVAFTSAADDLARATGLLPARSLPQALLEDPARSAAALRGLLLAGGSFSAPRRAPHLEVHVPTESAADLHVLFERASGAAGAVSPSGRGHRLVVKDGAAIGRMLEVAGGVHVAARWNDARAWRQQRSIATAMANADGANLQRSVDAADGQLRDVRLLLSRGALDELDPSWSQVALARLANPEAALAELGELCEPVLSKASVHRRMQRLHSLAEGIREQDRAARDAEG